MKFAVEKSEMIQKISEVESIVASSKLRDGITTTILVKINDGLCTLSTTDLETSMTTIFEVEELESGEICLPAKKLSESVRAFRSDKILFEIDSSKITELITLKDANKKSDAKITIMGFPSEDFPTIEVIENSNFQQLESAGLRHVINKTAFGIAIEDARYIFNGLYLESDGAALITAVSTDGRRLSKSVIETGFSPWLSEGIVVPLKSVKEIQKIIEKDSATYIYLNQESRKLFVKSKGQIFMTKLIDGQFPNHEEVIPKETKFQATINCKELSASLNQVSVMSEAPTNEIKFSLSENSLEIESVSPGKGESKDNFEIEYTGDEMEINFNSNFLSDILKVIQSENIVFEINTSNAPVIVKDQSDEGFISILMPIRRGDS